MILSPFRMGLYCQNRLFTNSKEVKNNPHAWQSYVEYDYVALLPLLTCGNAHICHFKIFNAGLIFKDARRLYHTISGSSKFLSINQFSAKITWSRVQKRLSRLDTSPDAIYAALIPVLIVFLAFSNEKAS